MSVRTDQEQKRKVQPLPKGTVKVMKSAFGEDEQYKLTALGDQFIQYAMTELPLRSNMTRL